MLCTSVGYPIDVHLAEPHDRCPDFLRQFLVFGGHDARQAHAILITQRLAEDIRIFPDASRLIETLCQ
jgi:hypothetical protein